MNFSWSIFVDLGIISAALLIATFLRSRVRFFQRYLIPNGLTAGFMLLPFYSFLAPRLGMNSEGLSNLGLTFAAIGYLWACFGGVYLINLGRKRGWMSVATAELVNQRRIRTGVIPPSEQRPVGSRLTTETEAIDTMSYNLAILLGVYLLSYLALRALTWALGALGPMGEQLATNFWGIAFIFAALVAMLVKRIFRDLGIDFTLDNGSLTRLAGVSVDIMVTAAIAAITIVLLRGFWVPILIVSVAGGIVTTVTVIYTASRLFTDHRFDRAIMFYGNMTGTLSTGLALLRVIDPDFETPVATDYMYGSGITFVLAIPLILLLNLPGYWHTTGNPLYLWMTWGGLGAYLVFSMVSYRLLAGRRAFLGGPGVWMEE